MVESKEPEKIWVSLSGLPLTFAFQWPFHRSTSGADFWVLHGDIRVANSDELHAPVAVNLSATVREVLPSLEPNDAEAPVINALRKEIDRKQIEFVKSGKLVPVAFSSRYYDFKRQKWMFGKASDEVIAAFLERKIYWESKTGGESRAAAGDGARGEEQQVPRFARNDKVENYRNDKVENAGNEKVENAQNDEVENAGNAKVESAVNDKIGAAANSKVWIGDPVEAQYLETTPEHLIEVAGRLVANGLIRIEGEWAEATAGLMARSERMEGAARAAIEELERKHAFEHG
jgi:hypothetical protein